MPAPERRAGRGRGVRLAALALALLAAGCGEATPGAEPTAAESGAEDLRRIVEPAGRARVHLVRVVTRADRHAFEPEEVRLRPGDVLRFVATSHQPESIAFDTAALDPARLDFLRERGATRGPLLVQPGQLYEIDFRAAPPGEYPFHSVSHRDVGMRGVAVVE